PRRLRGRELREAMVSASASAVTPGMRLAPGDRVAIVERAKVRRQIYRGLAPPTIWWALAPSTSGTGASHFTGGSAVLQMAGHTAPTTARVARSPLAPNWCRVGRQIMTTLDDRTRHLAATWRTYPLTDVGNAQRFLDWVHGWL